MDRKNLLKGLPNSPGVYLFKNAGGEVLYVGKAINVKKRVSSYFVKNLVSGKTAVLVKRIVGIETIPVTSELEALLLEASLIKKYKPFFNTIAKDDKHPLYIKITESETYPRIFLVRCQDMSGKTRGKSATYFGPFPSSQTVKKVLSMLRSIFPFDTQKNIGKKPCFWSHIGFCDPCPSWIESLLSEEKKVQITRYRKNLKNIVDILSRKTGRVREGLIREMTELSRVEHFEEAQVIRDQIRWLDYVTHPYQGSASFLENPNLVVDIREEESGALAQLLRGKGVKIGKEIHRIECFDASHTGMALPTVGMATFIDGEPVKNLYRRFKIKREKSQDDLSFLEEALTRRLKRADWGMPDLLIMDGGRTQVGRARDVLKKLGIKIPLVGIVKPFDDIVVPHQDGFQIIKPRSGPALRLLQRLRDEAHRFSRAYHFNLRNKRFLGKI